METDGQADKTPDVEPVGTRSRLHSVCRWMTGRPAMAVFSLVLAYADKKLLAEQLLGLWWVAFVLSALFWYAALRLAARSFLFSLIIFFPLFLDLVAEVYVVHVYHVEYVTVVETAFYTTPQQAGPFFTLPAVASLVAAVAAVILLPVAGRMAGVRGAGRALLAFVLVCGCILFVVEGPAKYYLSTYKRYNWNWATWLGDVAERDDLHRDRDFRAYVDAGGPEVLYLPCARLHLWYTEAGKKYWPVEYRDCAGEVSECLLQEGQGVNVVLYIVESFRRDHSPLHGYTRNTLPLLSGKHGGNIIVLPRLRSFGTHSVQSLYGMLSDADDTCREARYNCFQALFRKHGFNCVLLENNAFGASWSDRSVFRQLLKNCADTSLIVHSDNDFPRITAAHVAAHRRNMFIIYDGTSHYPFDEGAGGRYGGSLIDHYDETRHGIDEAASRFLDSLADTPAIVLITSDHGESFGEEGRVCHGGPLSATEQREVFAVIWYSDAYAAQFPHIVQALKGNAAAFTSHDFFFHTIPSMGGIHSSLRKPEWDMTEPRPRASGTPASQDGE